MELVFCFEAGDGGRDLVLGLEWGCGVGWPVGVGWAEAHRELGVFFSFILFCFLFCIFFYLFLYYFISFYVFRFPIKARFPHHKYLSIYLHTPNILV